jgi:hypothetical protein
MPRLLAARLQISRFKLSSDMKAQRPVKTRKLESYTGCVLAARSCGDISGRVIRPINYRLHSKLAFGKCVAEGGSDTGRRITLHLNFVASLRIRGAWN